MIFSVFLKNLGYWIFLVHPTVVSVLLSASVERCFVSRMRDFFIHHILCMFCSPCSSFYFVIFFNGLTTLKYKLNYQSVLVIFCSHRSNKNACCYHWQSLFRNPRLLRRDRAGQLVRARGLDSSEPVQACGLDSIMRPRLEAPRLPQNTGTNRRNTRLSNMCFLFKTNPTRLLYEYQ